MLKGKSNHHNVMSFEQSFAATLDAVPDSSLGRSRGLRPPSLASSFKALVSSYLSVDRILLVRQSSTNQMLGVVGQCSTLEFEQTSIDAFEASG